MSLAKRQAANIQKNRFAALLPNSPSVSKATGGSQSCSSLKKLSQKAQKPSVSANTQRKRSREENVERGRRSRTNPSSKSSAASIRSRLPRHKQLRALKVKDPTLLRYASAVALFQAYCRRRRLVNHSIADVDLHLCEYFADLCDQNRPYNDASYALFGYIVLHADESMPERDLLPRARQALKGWNAHYPQCSRTGADFLIWFLLCEHLLAQSPAFAAILLLQLDTYARPSEIINVRKRDVIRPVSKQCKFWGIIFGNSGYHERTKTGTQDDTVLLDSFNDFAPKVMKLVFEQCPHDGDFLFPNITLAAYEDALKIANQQAGLQKFSFTPHAVRHSGPSVDFLHHSRSAEEIMARGRWATLKSIQRYRKPGQMLAKMAKIPQAIWTRAEKSLPVVLRQLKSFYGGTSPR